MRSLASRQRQCVNVLVFGLLLVVCSAALLNVLYAPAKNEVALSREYWTGYTNRSHELTYEFHPLSSHGVCMLYYGDFYIVFLKFDLCPFHTFTAKTPVDHAGWLVRDHT